jgi:hypothetical protein
MYFGMPTDGLIGNTLKVHVYDVPVKLAAKPDDVFKAERAELLQQKLKLDKDEAVTLGKDTGRDLYFTSTAEDPEFGFAVIRMRWFVHGGKLWMVEGSTMTKAKERAAMEKQNDRWVESFAFTDKAPAKPVPAKKPVTKKKKR